MRRFRNDTDYSSTGVTEFLQPLLVEFLTDYPELPLQLRGDSVFAKPELYEQCETNDVSYVIRLNENSTLIGLASSIDERLIFILFLLTNLSNPKNT